MSETLRHKTAVIIGTVTPVPGYPKKLKVYLNNASPYWQAVYWDKGKTYLRTMQTEDKLIAYDNAKVFYEMLILQKYQHPTHLKNHVIVETNKPVEVIQPDHSFKEIATQWLTRQTLKWTARHAKNVEQRLSYNMYGYVAHKNIQHISKSDLLGILQKIEERGAYDLARRLLNDCRQIWQYAMVLDICKQDCQSASKTFH
jgi:hypothetical protein